ncbi:MAG: hypothetical protein V4447_06785 [Pseudomonadota bacterium]
MKLTRLASLFSLMALFSINHCLAQSPVNKVTPSCGELITITTHDASTTRYAYHAASPPDSASAPITLLLLAGGSGYIDLDEQACPRALKGNSLIRMMPIFSALGFATALVDAPSDYHGVDGLGGYRIKPLHAQDLGKLITDLRVRTQGAVWLVGTSRGTISAVNAASRLTGSAAADGVVLTSALMSGQSNARISWVAQSVFDLPLEEIHAPLLVIGHEKDGCPRSPSTLMGKILAQSKSARQKMLTVTGGPGDQGSACEGYSAHGYITQEEEVASVIARFIRGENDVLKK